MVHFNEALLKDDKAYKIFLQRRAYTEVTNISTRIVQPSFFSAGIIDAYNYVPHTIGKTAK
jgi:hypothetical protein